MLKKYVVVFVFILFISMIVFPSTGTTALNKSSMAANYNGSLSGFVSDTLMNPIEGARVRVHFHGTYEEDFTDSSGYYHVTNIPICYCLKNCTASKYGYNTEWVFLAITEETTYDFVLEPLTDYNGSLSGYVNDTLMNPIEGARARVYFHETYEEDYTDSSGYYHVTNIPICYCLKNATASKVGYETEWILLSITENTTHDFVLTSLDSIPDLDCEGDFAWIDIKPDSSLSDEFLVRNIGEPGSELNWEIESSPSWGTWTFNPNEGTDLTPEDGQITVNVEVVTPAEPETEFTGEVKVVNSDDPDDFCIVDVSLATPVNQEPTGLFDWIFLRGLVFNPREDGSRINARAINLHYIELSPEGLKRGVVRLKTVSFRNGVFIKMSEKGLLGNMVRISGFCHGGIDIQ